MPFGEQKKNRKVCIGFFLLFFASILPILYSPPSLLLLFLRFYKCHRFIHWSDPFPFHFIFVIKKYEVFKMFFIFFKFICGVFSFFYELFWLRPCSDENSKNNNNNADKNATVSTEPRSGDRKHNCWEIHWYPSNKYRINAWGQALHIGGPRAWI